MFSPGMPVPEQGRCCSAELGQGMPSAAPWCRQEAARLCPRASLCCCSGGMSPRELHADLLVVAGTDVFWLIIFSWAALGQRSAREAVGVD